MAATLYEKSLDMSGGVVARCKLAVDRRIELHLLPSSHADIHDALVVFYAMWLCGRVSTFKKSR